MNFRTINDLNNLINKKIHILPKDIDLVVGVPRSGMFVATLLGLYLNLPVTDFESLLNNRMYSCGETKKRENWIDDVREAKKILIVEDSASSGNAMIQIKNQIKNTTFVDKIVYLAVYVCDKGKDLVDFYFEECNQPRLFEWNYFHHIGIKRACFDLDGVLCSDPTEEQNDDGEKYIDFILNAPLRVAPTFEIGTIVTSRLEKYRPQTEEWLKKNEIKYGNLVMMNFATKEERLASGSHGTYKGKVYKKLKNANIFIESDARQAQEIANISGKAVFCIENQMVYEEGVVAKSKNETKRFLVHLVQRIFPKSIVDILKKIYHKMK